MQNNSTNGLQLDNYYQEYSTKEISDILQLSVNTVKSRLQRGREKLAKILEKQV